MGVSREQLVVGSVVRDSPPLAALDPPKGRVKAKGAQLQSLRFGLVLVSRYWHFIGQSRLSTASRPVATGS